MTIKWKNEIDLVAINDMKTEIVIAEIKFNKSKINLERLKQKSQGLLATYPYYTPEWLGLCLDDAENYIL